MVTSVSEQQLREIAQKHYPSRTLKSSERLKGGVSADVFKLTTESASGEHEQIVLRIHGESHAGHSATLEFDLLRALFDQGILLPEPLIKDESKHPVPYPYLMIRFVEGSTHVDVEQAESAIEKMAKALQDIHSKTDLVLPNLPTRANPLEHINTYLPGEQEFAHLPELVARFDGEFKDDASLLHGDYWPENVLWRDGEIVSILDWEDSALGDPVSDVACCYVELRYIHGLPGAEQFLAAYRRHAEVDPLRLLLWQIHVASAAHKYMGQWGLPAEQEAHMHRTTLQVIREASETLQSYLTS